MNDEDPGDGDTASSKRFPTGWDEPVGEESTRRQQLKILFTASGREARSGHEGRLPYEP